MRDAICCSLLSKSNQYFAQLRADLHQIYNAYTGKLAECIENMDSESKQNVLLCIRDKMALRIKLELKRIEYEMHNKHLEKYGISIENDPNLAFNELISILDFEIKRHQTTLQGNAAISYRTSSDIDRQICSFMQKFEKKKA